MRQRASHRKHPSPEQDSTDTVEAPVFSTLPLTSGIERMGALYLLRMIEGARLQSKLFTQINKHYDLDLLALTGLTLGEHSHEGMTPAHLTRELAAQHRRLSARGAPALRVLANNIANLGAALRLTSVECAMLQLALVIHRLQDFGDVFRLCGNAPEQLFSLASHATGVSVRQATVALSPDGTLRRTGLLGDFNLDRHTPLLEMDTEVATELLMPGFDIDRLLRRILRRSPPSSLTLTDYSHLPEAVLISDYLFRVMRKTSCGVNILIHGDPGTGKTEFVRALAAHLNARLGEVPVEGKQGKPISGPERFRAFSLAQALLRRERSQLLLFDEVEDVFGRAHTSFISALFGGSSSSAQSCGKGWINDTLETNPVPTVWVCNGIGSMDPAYLRRFDLVAEFRAPSRKIRQRIVKRYFPDDTLSPSGIEALAAMEALPPAQIARAARVVKTLGARKSSERDAHARRVLEMSLRAMGISTTKKTGALPTHYDPAFLNTDRDLAVLIEGLRVGRSARLCLYGPPGTGKSALGAHLAETLDRPLLVKRASDLLSMWIGKTEQNIAKTFQDACDEGAILLIDEVDTFLQDRSGAKRSWEISLVNEMLTQMEAFEGVFIASTNLVGSLDAASLRRFDFKIRFDYLSRIQRIALFQRVLGDTTIDEPMRHRIERLEHFAPGDMANALRQMRVMGETPSAAGLLALIEGELRLKSGNGKSAIGFVH